MCSGQNKFKIVGNSVQKSVKLLPLLVCGRIKGVSKSKSKLKLVTLVSPSAGKFGSFPRAEFQKCVTRSKIYFFSQT